MKVLLVGINSKYVHSNLALYYLRNATPVCYDTRVMEFSINQPVIDIIRNIYQTKADVIGISTYIWNREYVTKILDVLPKLLPNAKIVLGGPEATYNQGAFCGTDIICGDGELKWRKYLADGFLDSSMSRSPNDSWDFPYTDEDMSALGDKVLYYESQRGCPYHCSYCLSSLTNGVSYLPLEQVYRDFQWFSHHGVKQVKFVDRTFNSNPKRAVAIVRHLNEMDYDHINFHFELKGDLLTSELIEALNQAKLGYIKVEIGVQSTYDKALKAIGRAPDLDSMFTKIKSLLACDNIHVHLDLIAGLPYETYDHFKESFNDVMALYPHEMQLGFLKLLPSTPIKDMVRDMGYVALSCPPYEVLRNDFISYDEMIWLKLVEDTVEEYYNSLKYVNTIKYAMKMYHGSQHDLFLELAQKPGTIVDRLSASMPDYEDHFIELYRHDGYLHSRNYKDKYIDDKLKHDITLSFIKDEKMVRKYLPQYVGIDGRQLYKMILVVPYSKICRGMIYVYDSIDLVYGSYKSIQLENNDIMQFI